MMRFAWKVLGWDVLVWFLEEVGLAQRWNNGMVLPAGRDLAGDK